MIFVIGVRLQHPSCGLLFGAVTMDVIQSVSSHKPSSGYGGNARITGLVKEAAVKYEDARLDLSLLADDGVIETASDSYCGVEFELNAQRDNAARMGDVAREWNQAVSEDLKLPPALVRRLTGANPLD
jgi:hypothetical protein